MRIIDFQNLVLVSSLSTIAAYCPGSPVAQHAECYVNVFFEGSTCANVRKEINSRINGQASGAWTDPHNAGNYTMLDQAGNDLQISRVTGDGKYTDLIVFQLIQDYSNCRMSACSESQVYSVGDAGTNFCNIHDLYCAEEGCNPFTVMSYTEDVGTCTEASPKKCIA